MLARALNFFGHSGQSLAAAYNESAATNSKGTVASLEDMGHLMIEGEGNHTNQDQNNGH
jgi:hypothetical protein